MFEQDCFKLNATVEVTIKQLVAKKPGRDFLPQVGQNLELSLWLEPAPGLNGQGHITAPRGKVRETMHGHEYFFGVRSNPRDTLTWTMDSEPWIKDTILTRVECASVMWDMWRSERH